MAEKKPVARRTSTSSASSAEGNRNRRSRGMQRSKKTKRARFNIGGCIGRILLLAIFCLGIFFFLQSSLFTVETIEVRGNERVSEEDILALAGIETGGNLFDVERSEAAKKVELHSAVKEAMVKTRPFHKILITVKERNSVAWIPGDEGYYLLDDAGFLFMEREEYNDYVPLITGLNLPVALSTGLSLDDVKGIHDAIEVATVFSDYYRGQLRQLHYTQKGNFVFFVGDLQLRLGKNESMWKKRRIIDDLLEQIPASRLSEVNYIDVSSPGNPVVNGYDIAYEARKAKEEEKARKAQEKEKSLEKKATTPEENPKNNRTPQEEIPVTEGENPSVE